MWEILGITPTEDIRKIQSAYARLAKQFNPEEKPEEFKRIFEAYKAACRYAKSVKKEHLHMRLDEDVQIASGADIEKDANTGGKNDTSADDVTSEYDFSEIDSNDLEEAELTHEEKRQVLLKIMSDIISDESKCNDKKVWQGFLDCDELDDFIYEPQFRREVNSLLAAALFTWETANIITEKFGWGSDTNPWEYCPFNLRIYRVKITDVNILKWENMSPGVRISVVISAVIFGVAVIAFIIYILVVIGILIRRAVIGGSA